MVARHGVVTLARQNLGKAGEDCAVAELERRGYAILARRYRTRHGEIDIIARDEETTVFVEVKARATDEFGAAAEALTPWKRGRLVRMATDYIARNGLENQRCRFDVVAIDEVGSPSQKVTVFTHAFEAWR